MVTTKSSEDINRTSILYWLLGGDIFWFHFKMKFLKQLLLYIVTIQIVIMLVVIFFKIQTIPFIVGFSIQTVQTLLLLSPFLSTTVATYILKTNSTIKDIRWLLVFLLILSLALLITTITGYVNLAGVQINGLQ